MEIERRFLVDRLPDSLNQYPSQFLEQAYLSTDPVIRIRRSGDGPEDENARYLLTCKGEGLLSREEFELPLKPEAYTRLLAKAEGNRITKTRYRIPLGDVVIELDVYGPPFAPLVVAEVEFPDEASALAFHGAGWFGREVTYDSAYTNAALSQKTFETLNH